LRPFQFDGDLKEDGNEDKLATKIDAIKDCAILLCCRHLADRVQPGWWAKQHPSDESQ